MRIKSCQIPEYKKFRENRIVTIDDEEIVGENTLTKMLGERQLCSQYNRHKLQAFQDLLNDTDDRLIVFYNFTAEKDILARLVERPISLVNGEKRDWISIQPNMYINDEALKELARKSNEIVKAKYRRHG